MTERDPLARAPWTEELEVLVIVGAPRSGTTWLQSLLACHPAIATGPETHFFRTLASAEVEFGRQRDRPLGVSEYWSAEQFREVVERMFWGLVSQLPPPRDPPRYFAEKTPIHCMYAEFILRVLPRARFLHVIRDGRAVAASLLRASKGWGKSWAPDTIWKAAERWGVRVRAGRAIRELVEDERHYGEVRYEDVRRNPEAALAVLFDWLDLEADAGLVEGAVRANALENSGAFASIRMAGASENTESSEAYPVGFVGPAPVDPTLIDLTGKQVRRFEVQEGQLLEELGYPLLHGHGGWRTLLADRIRRAAHLPPY